MKKIFAAVLTFGMLATGAHAFTTRDVQQGLIYLGYNPGPVDGAMGSKTRAAFKQFWLDEFGEEYSGKIDRSDYALIGSVLEERFTDEDFREYVKFQPNPIDTLETGRLVKISTPVEYPFSNGGSKPVSPKHNFTVGRYNVVDINGDQCSDLLLWYMDSYQHPRILLGNRDISSSEAPLLKTFPKTRSIRNIAQKDLDGDGLTDFVGFTAPHALGKNGLNSGGREKDVIHFTSSGTALLPISTSAHGGLIGDVNGDGNVDIFPIEERPDYKRFALLGDGKGKFEKKFRVRLPFKTVIFDAVSADFNGDGVDDFAFLSAVDERYNKFVTPEYYRKNGSFKIAYGERGKSINELKFQSYGKHWMTDQHWTAWRLLHNQKDSAYDTGRDNAYTAPSSIHIFDADEDGDPDILVSYFVSSNSSWITSGFEIYENLGDHFVDATEKFAPFQMANQNLSRPTGHFLRSQHVDINNDGRKDLIFTILERYVHPIVSSRIYLNLDNKYVPVRNWYTHILDRSDLLTTGDFNCDGYLDIVTRRNNFAEIRLGKAK